MKTRNLSNTLLMELLIVIFFFMIASTVLLQVFAGARSQNAKAELLTEASVEAQNLAEQLYAAGDTKALLLSLGFSENDGQWRLEKENYTEKVFFSEETAESGRFLRQQVVISAGEDVLIALPCSRYEEADG